MLRIVQPGTENAPVVALWFCDARPRAQGGTADTEARAAMLRAALPGACILASHERDLGPAPALLAAIRALAPGAAESRPLVAVGWSAACQTVRTLAAAGILDGAIVLDGTSGSVPPNDAMHVAPWRAMAERARRREALFVATCTQQSYTEALPSAQRYAWTRHILEIVTGRTLDAGTELHDGALHVYSVPSAKIDASAHVAQLTQWLPRILTEHVAPWIGGGTEHPEQADTQPDTQPAPMPTAHAPVAPWRDWHLPLGSRLVLWMRAEEAANVREEPPGSNTSPRIREYLARCLRRGTEASLGITSGAWCGAMAGFGLVECALPGEAHPTPRAAGVEYEQGAMATGDWFTADDVLAGRYEPVTGDLVICDRSKSPGAPAWGRHVCVFVERHGAQLLTIGGNEGDRVRETPRMLNGHGESEPILGFIRLTRTAVVAPNVGPLETVV